MNEDQYSAHQDPALSRPPITTEDFQPALPRPVIADDEVTSSNDESWSFAPGRDEAVETTRPVAPSEILFSAPIKAEPFFEPNEQPRPIMVVHGEVVNSGMPEHGQQQKQVVSEEVMPAAQSPRPAMPEGSPSVSPDQTIDEIETKQEVKEVNIEDEPQSNPTPPDTAVLVTVEEAVLIFRERGLPRHMRTIQKYCSRTTGRALVSYQVPTENGIRYMIDRSSIDRFIGDAAQQAPTGKIMDEPMVEPVAKSREEVPAPAFDTGALFEHPIVQRLEAQVERLESRNEQLQSRIQNVLIDANERLIELQKANAVAQSENLGTFLLEAERIRRQEGTPVDPSAVNREGELFGGIGV